MPEPRPEHIEPVEPEVGRKEILQFVDADLKKTTFDRIVQLLDNLTESEEGIPLRFKETPFQDEIFRFANIMPGSKHDVSPDVVVGRRWSNHVGTHVGSLQVGCLSPLGRGLATGAHSDQGPGQRIGYIAFSKELEDAALTGKMWLLEAAKHGDIQISGEVTTSKNPEINSAINEWASLLGVNELWLKATTNFTAGTTADFKLFMSDQMGHRLTRSLQTFVDQSVA